MDQEQIKTLIDAMAASDLAEMEFSEDGWTLRLGAAVGAGRPPCDARPADAAAQSLGAADAARAGAPLTDRPSCLAPLYGVVHLQPSPDEPPSCRPASRRGRARPCA